jgi:hypothetical protein
MGVRQKHQLHETALIYWAENCNPTKKELVMLSEIAFEHQLDNLLEFVEALRKTRFGKG